MVQPADATPVEFSQTQKRLQPTSIQQLNLLATLARDRGTPRAM